MSGSDTIVCPTCSRRYAFKPESAGKRAKCKCGEILQFPATGVPKRKPAPAPAVFAAAQTPNSSPPADDPFEALNLPSDIRNYDPENSAYAEPVVISCRKCRAPLPEGTVVCLQCGCNQKTGECAGTQVIKERPAPKAVKKKRAQKESSYVQGGLTGGDWILIIIFPGIGACVGIVRLLMGKFNGAVLLLFSIFSTAIWLGIRFMILAAMQK